MTVPSRRPTEKIWIVAFVLPLVLGGVLGLVGAGQHAIADPTNGLPNPGAIPYIQAQSLPLEDELIESAVFRAQLALVQGSQQAQSALEQLRIEEDTTPLLEFLVAERAVRDDDAIHRDREIAHLAARLWRIDLAEEAVQRLLRQAPDDPDALVRRGHLDLLQGRLDLSMKAYQRVLEIADAVDVDSWRGTAYGNIGLIHQKRGQLDQAERMYRNALEVFEAVDQPSGKAGAYDNLGLIYRARGDLDKAELMIHKALEVSEAYGLRNSLASQTSHLGLILQMRGDLDGAERLQRRALSLFEELNQLQGVAQVASNLGLIHLSRDDLDAAELAFLRAMSMNERLGRVEGIAKARANLGLVYQTRGQLEEAERLFREALAIEQALGRALGMANQFGNLGLVRSQLGDYEAARDSWQASRDLFAQIGMPHMVRKVDWLLQSLPSHDPQLPYQSSAQVETAE